MAYVRVRQDGTITIPAQIRRQGQFVPGAWVLVQPAAGGKLELTPKALNCSLCGRKVPTLDPQTNICPKCVNLIVKLVRSGASWSGAIKAVRDTRCQ